MIAGGAREVDRDRWGQDSPDDRPHHTALTPRDAALCLAIGLVPVTAVELAKLVRAGRGRIRTGRG